MWAISSTRCPFPYTQGDARGILVHCLCLQPTADRGRRSLPRSSVGSASLTHAAGSQIRSAPLSRTVGAAQTPPGMVAEPRLHQHAGGMARARDPSPLSSLAGGIPRAFPVSLPPTPRSLQVEEGSRRRRGREAPLQRMCQPCRGGERREETGSTKRRLQVLQPIPVPSALFYVTGGRGLFCTSGAPCLRGGGFDVLQSLPGFA